MKFTSPTFLVAGLSNGNYAGWSLENGQVTEFKAH
jgi:hypothetical protein